MWARSITPFTISGKGSHCPTNTKVQKDMSNEFGIYQKHMQNNKSYMHINRIIYILICKKVKDKSIRYFSFEMGEASIGIIDTIPILA
ncbi:hypothetical protein BHE74_00054357 [Ensete ventricosum]|nr:hypothetical protein BHE74_00054357 [Ensete ventricosum]RZS06603.1 hypothetical protein BHM03_00037288 [Ensete ventricosum]